MRLLDRGTGPVVVLVPGIQGRWEYLRPAVDALAGSFRVITFPLCGEPGSCTTLDPTRGLDDYADQVSAVLDSALVDRAIVCGVSFGGLAALRFAARAPDRVSALVLVSTPSPSFRPHPRHRLYAKLPWMLGPLFILETPGRVWQEIRVALPDAGARWRFVWGQARALATAPVSVSRMAARGRLLTTAVQAYDLAADCRRVAAPTLVVTGERHLDRVVPFESSVAYTRLIDGAVAVAIPGSGHLGSITRPEVFASIVKTFVDDHRHAAA